LLPIGEVLISHQDRYDSLLHDHHIITIQYINASG
jgi:hypothetical protein